MRRAIAVHHAAHWPEEAAIDHGDAGLSRPASPPHPARRRFAASRFCSTCRGRSISPTATGSSSTMAAMSGCVRAPEPVLEIAAARPRGSAAHRLASRQPASAGAGVGERLRIRADHVIAAMVEGLGGRVTRLDAPFDPEIGAYAGAAHHRPHDDDHRQLRPPSTVPGSTGCWPGCRPAFRSARSAIRTGSKPPPRAARCTTATRCKAGSRAIVAQGSGRIDADILRDAYRAAAAGDVAALAAVNRRGLAYRATAELALESTAAGRGVSRRLPDGLAGRV